MEFVPETRDPGKKGVQKCGKYGRRNGKEIKQDGLGQSTEDNRLQENREEQKKAEVIDERKDIEKRKKKERRGGSQEGRVKEAQG